MLHVLLMSLFSFSIYSMDTYFDQETLDEFDNIVKEDVPYDITDEGVIDFPITQESKNIALNEALQFPQQFSINIQEEIKKKDIDKDIKKALSHNMATTNKAINAKKIKFKSKAYYQCIDCKEIHTDYTSAYNHFIQKHAKPDCQIVNTKVLREQMVNCNFPNCNFVCEYKDLNKHKLTHTYDLQCNYPNCNKSYKNKTSFFKHFESSHNNFLYQCTQCNKILTDSYSLDLHIKSVHMYVLCNLCLKILKADSLISHAKTAHQFTDQAAREEQKTIRTQINYLYRLQKK